MHKYLAHATETHIDANESLTHLLETWYTALPIYLIVSIIIFFLAFTLSKKSINTSFITLSFWFLATGIMLYDTSPIISTVGVVVGLLSSAIFAFGGLSKR